MENSTKAFIQLHASVLLAGFTGLFGKLITLNEVDIVWWRMAFTTLILLVFTGLPKIAGKRLLSIFGTGTLLGLHWILFYGSIKLSNISIGVVCFALTSLFTAIFEPLLGHRKLSLAEIGMALLTALGLACIFSFDARYRMGIAMGAFSSAVCSLYAIFNKRVSAGIPSRTVLMYQMAGGLMGVSVIIPIYLHFFPAATSVLVVPEGSNLWWMLCHALFCTVGLYLLQIMALKQLSAFTVNLTYNLEPCYTIAIALLFFGEARLLGPSFFAGITLVIFSVLLQMWRSMRMAKVRNVNNKSKN